MRRVRVVIGVGTDEGIEDVNIGVGELVEDVDGGDEVAVEGEGGDEFRNNVRVVVEIGFENLSVDLVYVVKVSAFVKVTKLIFKEFSS
ncbi:hypothetical protein Lal_00036804 [Lupinus albus]|nr:hypothetical protein Lal_00036804 [Lupinus albus]